MKNSIQLLLCVLGLLPATSLCAQNVPTSHSTAAESAPVKVLTGTVYSDMGAPLAGATVTVIGDKYNSITTNSVGGFVLRTSVSPPVLRITYAGFKDLEQTVNPNEPVSFTLEAIANYKRDLKKRSKAAVKAYKK